MKLKEFIELMSVDPSQGPRKICTGIQDLNALNLLAELSGKKSGHIIQNADNGTLWIDVDMKQLLKVITLEQLTTLYVYGVRYSRDNELLYMIA